MRLNAAIAKLLASNHEITIDLYWFLNIGKLADARSLPFLTDFSLVTSE
jgi:hypothetical protein